MIPFQKRPTQRAPDLGYAPRFLGIFLALAESRFEGESTLPPQAGNAGRWAPGRNCRELARRQRTVAPASRTPRAHTCKCISNQVMDRHGVCFEAQGLIFCSSALAALMCPLLVISNTRSNGFHRAGRAPAPQMLRDQMCKGVSLVKSIGAQHGVQRTAGSLRVF